jgi:hypothetical protein
VAEVVAAIQAGKDKFRQPVREINEFRRIDKTELTVSTSRTATMGDDALMMNNGVHTVGML